MIEKFAYKGKWWLHDKPQKQISGTLRFTPVEGAVLDLIGSFKDLQDMNKMLETEIILGVSSDGRNITLHNCFETESNFSSSGLLISSFYANEVFVGVHFQRPKDIKFKSLSIHYSYLDEWVNISGFNIQHRNGVLIEYKSPESIQAIINDDLKIFIDFYTAYPTISIVQKEACIKQKAYIKIEPSEDKSFDEYLNIMYSIQKFL